MWLNLVENPEIIQNIFGHQTPLSNSVELVKMEYVFGEDAVCRLTFNLKEYPKEPPQKWKNLNYNKSQIIFLLSSVMILKLTALNNNTHGTLSITQDSEYINFHFFSSENIGIEFLILCRWLYIEAVLGYQSG